MSGTKVISVLAFCIAMVGCDDSDTEQSVIPDSGFINTCDPNEIFETTCVYGGAQGWTSATYCSPGVTCIDGSWTCSSPNGRTDGQLSSARGCGIACRGYAENNPACSCSVGPDGAGEDPGYSANVSCN